MDIMYNDKDIVIILSQSHLRHDADTRTAAFLDVRVTARALAGKHSVLERKPRA